MAAYRLATKAGVNLAPAREAPEIPQEFIDAADVAGLVTGSVLLPDGSTAGVVMYDSTNPSAIPSSAALVASYVDGYGGYTAAVARFGAAKCVSISVGNNNAMVADVEPGAMTVGEVAGWVSRQKARGVARPCIYSDGSDYPSCRSAAGSSCSFWTANPTGVVEQTLSGRDAVQSVFAGSYDESWVLPSFPWYPGGSTSAPTVTATAYSVTANPPGEWQGMLVASGTGVGGTEYHTSSNDGKVWVKPRNTAIPAPIDRAGKFGVTGTIPGSWKIGTTLTLNGYGIDGNLWRTTTANGSKWTAPVMVSAPKPPVVVSPPVVPPVTVSPTKWAYDAPTGLTARGGKTTVFLSWNKVTATSPDFPAGKSAPVVASYTVEIGGVTRTATTNSIQVGSLAAGSHVAEVWANGGPVGPPHASVTFSTSGDGSTPTTGLAANMLAYCIKQEGKAYSFNPCTGPNSFDCSGLVFEAAVQNGVKIPSSVAPGAPWNIFPFFATYAGATLVKIFNEIQRGDIIFFDNTGAGSQLCTVAGWSGQIGHVGMVLSATEYVCAWSVAVGVAQMTIPRGNFAVAVRLP
jgi:cell wall-associated NlpC family hydrolase